MKMLIAGIAVGILISVVAVMVVACCINSSDISRRMEKWSNSDD